MVVAEVANREFFVAEGDKLRKKSTAIANAMAVELANYGIDVDAEIVRRISMHKESVAREASERILELYTIGSLNPPLFPHWETRTEFSFPEIVVQLMGYSLQISGNDLEDPAYVQRLRDRVEFKTSKRLRMAAEERAIARFHELVSATVALDTKTREELIALAARFHAHAPRNIRSDEARIAVLVGMVQAEIPLADALQKIALRPADALRYAAAVRDFDGVKLPADVRYANLPWAARVAWLAWLSEQDFDNLNEAMGNNRAAWVRYFRHTHLLQQPDYRKRFTSVVAAAYLAIGSKMEAVPPAVAAFLKANQQSFEFTASGNLAFRTFASRLQTAIDQRDMEAFKTLAAQRPGLLFRNIGSMSHVCTTETQGEFVEFVRGLIDQVSVAVLFSIVQIDVKAKYRIIDSKGDTTVRVADYSPVIAEIQGLAEREIYRRHGLPGQVKVSQELQQRIVPFLSTNAELDRGSRVAIGDERYVYFLLKWVQSARRTDLDHSLVAFDHEWNAETIYFGNQANSYITHGGDLTNAPAPEGATEYSRIDLSKVPKKVRYIVPCIHVYCGDAFADLDTAYAGWMFSESATFSLQQEHARYDLKQPAKANIPLVIDVQEREVIIIDFNNRRPDGITAHSSVGEMQKIISAVETKNFMTIGRLANLLSGDGPEESLRIRKKASKKREIEPLALHTLFE